MASDPTTATATRGTFTGWIAQQHLAIGYGLFVVAVLFFALALFLGLKAFETPAPAKKEGEKEKKELIETKAKDKEKDKDKIGAGLGHEDYVWPTAWAVLVGILAGTLGLWRVTRPEMPEWEPGRARLLVIVFGGTFGLLTAFLGLRLAYQWRDSILNWLTENQVKEARWILLALTVYFVGLAVMFFSLQPARAEERSNSTLRRLVYGFNSVLTGLLLLLVLAVGNVMAGLKLPTILDTTATRLYSLSDRSREFLRELKQPVHAYLILQTQNPIYYDVRAMLTNAHDVNPNFKVTLLSPSVDRDQVTDLLKRLKVPESQWTTGVILAVGDKEEQVSMVSLRDMVDSEFNEETKENVDVFSGEARLMTELSFLAEGKTKPIIYFTQGAGELDMGESPGRARGARTANELKQYLTQRNFDVRTVKPELGSTPKVDGATAVVVLSPQAPLDPAMVNALRAYLQPDKLGSKSGGKLMALLPPVPERNGKDIAPTGLEPLLAPFDVQLESEVLMSFPSQLIPRGGPMVLLEPSPEVLEADTPFRRVLREVTPANYVRGVTAGAARGPKGPAITWQNLLTTTEVLPIWHETNFQIVNGRYLELSNAMLKGDKQLITEKRAGRSAIPVVVLGAEGGSPLSTNPQSGGKPRLAVYGTGECFGDEFLRRGDIEPETYLELFTATLDWLRERPSNIGIKPREIKSFRMEKNYSFSRAFTLPVVMVLLGIVGLGVGVWVVRRR